jgi:hypothetical protein
MGHHINAKALPRRFPALAPRRHSRLWPWTVGLLIGWLAWSCSGQGLADESVPYDVAVGEPPVATAPEFRAWLDALIDFRLSECPLEQPTVYYFSAFGNDANDGLTPTSAKRTVAAAQAIIDAAPDPAALRLRFRRGDVWYVDEGLFLNKSHITVDSYGPSPKPPLFSRFTTVLVARWRVQGNGVYWQKVTGPVAWVYDTRGSLDRPFYRAASIADVGAVPPGCGGAWYYDAGTSRVYVNLGGANPNSASLRGLPPNDDIGCGIAAHGCRLDGLMFLGFGLDPDGTSNQAAGIKVTVRYFDAAVVTNCESYYCSSHALHFNGGGNPDYWGGIATFVDCRAGYCQWNASGETVFNAFVFGGDNETIFQRCDAVYGTLPDAHWYEPGEVEVRGQSFFAHSGSDGRARLLIAADCAAANSPFGCAKSAKFTDAALAATIEQARSFIIGEFFVQSRPGCIVDISPPRGVKTEGLYVATLGNNSFRAWSNSQQSKGWIANCRFDVDMSHLLSGNVAMYNSVDPNMLHAEHCDFVMYVNPGHKVRIPDYDADASLQASFHNCVFAVIGMPQSVTVGYGSPLLASNGYFNTAQSTGNDPSPVMIVDEAELAEFYVPEPGAASYAAGTEPLFPVWIDRFEQLRHESPSLGDLEHSD